MVDNYPEFLELLDSFKKDRLIKLLYRGVTKDFAFNCLNLDLKFNTIDQFAEQLFYFGEKSKYFWNERINASKHDFNFDINDISDDFFKFIFNEFNKLILANNKIGTKKYFDKNLKTILFFKQLENCSLFLEKVRLLSQTEKTRLRNYYLRILHQLGESAYKANSQFISSSTNERIAKFREKNEIIINFWDLDFTKQHQFVDLPMFEGKPYEKQKEISVFTVILPHYIYSFKYKNIIYPNPAIKTTRNLELAIFNGLDIKQDSILEKLKKQTNYEKGVETDGYNYKEIK
jgi:hypothetical protein